MKKRTIRARSGLIITSAILTLLLAAGLASCVSTGHTNGTESSSISQSESEQTPLVGIQMKPDSGVIVSSVYATSWEKTAAETLKSQFSAKEIVMDDETADGDYRIVVGYTDLNEELGADFDAIGDLGYMVKVIDKTVLIMANTEAGMTDALAAFNAAVIKDDEGHPFITSDTNLKVEKNTEVSTPNYTGAWDENIDYAKDMQNQVQTFFTDDSRTQWTLSNSNVILNCDLNRDTVDRNKNDKYMYSSITNANGVPYMLNTGAVYLVDKNGKTYSTEGTRSDGTTNIYELGYYYNNTHIQDFGFASGNNAFTTLKLDTTLHMYSDKLNVVQHIVCTLSSGTRNGLAGYGQFYEIDADRVLQFVAKDKKGLHYSYDEVDWSTAEYVAFDIERAGVIGFILLDHKNSGDLTVTLQDGKYIIDQRTEHDAEKEFDSSLHLYFGLRLYTDATHSFDAFLNEAKAERDPLAKLSGDELTGSFQAYDALRGAYKGWAPSLGWGTKENPNDYKLSTVGFTGDELDRKFYYYTDCGFGALECAVVLDENMSLLPIELQVTKNFSGENEEPVYDPGDVHYGNTYIPVTLKAGETKTFTLVDLNQNWGQTPLKQLSSVQFYSPYYHLSLGASESNCITPHGVNGKDYWTLPDFRPVSESSLTYDGTQYWAASVIQILQYKDINGVEGGIENYYNYIDASGPTYADITMNYLSVDRRLHVTYRHTELPNTDENRTLYQVRIDILEDITFADFAQDVKLFSFNGRGMQFGTLTYLNENNEVTYEQIMTEKVSSITNFEHDRYIKLGNEPGTYFGYYNSVNYDQEFLPNFALIIKSSDIKIGGETFTGNFLLHDYFSNNMNQADLTLDIQDEVTLKAGDYIYFDIILLPWGRQYEGLNTNPNENDDSIQNVRHDTVEDPFVITASKGTVIEDVYVPKVKVDENGVAQFTVTGGANNAVVRVYGLKSYAAPVIEEILASGNQPYSNASEHGYDGYYVYAEDDGTYSISFVFSMDGVGEEGRTFIVKAAE